MGFCHVIIIIFEGSFIR